MERPPLLSSEHVTIKCTHSREDPARRGKAIQAEAYSRGNEKTHWGGATDQISESANKSRKSGKKKKPMPENIKLELLCALGDRAAPLVHLT